jgi:hypothetical protein
MSYFKKIVGYSYWYQRGWSKLLYVEPIYKTDWNKVRIAIALTVVPIVIIIVSLIK